MTPWIVLATIVGYFILLFIISWAVGHKSDTATALSGGRQAPWFIVAIAMLGAPISGGNVYLGAWNGGSQEL